jgi:hypothetical protein
MWRGLRDVTRRHVIEGLADDGEGASPGGAGCWWPTRPASPNAVSPRPGVIRPYSGALGGVVPCQIGVMAAWATGAGQALIDRALYVPKGVDH